jgi:hypothetical protein
MGQNLDTSGIARRRVRVGQIVLVVVLLLLVLCLLASLVANVGLGGWALWTYRELRRERERVEALQSEVDRLQQVLQENGVNIPLSPGDIVARA